MKFLQYLLSLIKHLWCLLKESDKGYIVLPYGTHIVKIQSCCPASRVFINIIGSEDGCQVCGNENNINKVGCQITDDGFIIYADITSNYATIEWLIKFEDN